MIVLCPPSRGVKGTHTRKSLALFIHSVFQLAEPEKVPDKKGKDASQSERVVAEHEKVGD